MLQSVQIHHLKTRHLAIQPRIHSTRHGQVNDQHIFFMVKKRGMAFMQNMTRRLNSG